MGFKMKKMIFGKGTGSAREAAKTHAKTNHISINRGTEFYTGGIPNQPGYVSSDDPDQFRKLYSDQDYLSFGGDPDDHREEGQLLPGDSAKRYDKVKPAGPVKEAGEGHENYFGLKDESAGYDKFNLGRPNEQEKYEQQRFGRDLQKNLANYRSKLPISGDLKLDDESFENWKELSGHTGDNSRLRKLFENETTQALNLDNELKLAADAGYKPPNHVLEDHNIDMSEGKYKLNEARYQLNQDQKDLRQIAMANRKAANARYQAEKYVDKHGGTIADFLEHRPHLRDDLQGIHSFGQVDVDTQDFFDNAMYEGMDKQEKKEYDAKKEKEKQEELQLQADIQANLPADESSDPTLSNEPTVEEKTSDTNLSDKPTVEIENDKKLVEETSGEEEEEYVPITQRFKPDDTPDEQPPADDPPPVDDPSPVDEPSGEPEYGTDEYWAQKKAKRSKMLGLTKRPLNIHGRI